MYELLRSNLHLKQEDKQKRLKATGDHLKIKLGRYPDPLIKMGHVGILACFVFVIFCSAHVFFFIN